MLLPRACVVLAVLCLCSPRALAGPERAADVHAMPAGMDSTSRSTGTAAQATRGSPPPASAREVAESSPNPVVTPPGFTDVGLALGPCEFVSTNASLINFNFDLTLLSEFAANAAAPNLVVWEDPPGHTLVYYASPCSDLNIPDVPPFQGSCSGDMAVCFCTSTFQKCDNIAIRTTLNWLVSTSEFEALTVVQQFTAPNCESDYSKSWNTYLIYECDVTPNGYGLGQRSHAIAGEYGLCPTTNGTSCTQCILWQTNYACEPFASAQESFVEFGSGWSPEVVSGSSTPSVVTLVTRTQFQQAVGHGGDYVVATVEGDDSSLLSWSVHDNQDGTYDMPFTAAAGLQVGATYTFNVTVSLDGNPVESFLLSAIGSNTDPGGGDVIGIVLGTLGAIMGVTLVIMGVRFAKGYTVCPTGRETARRAAASREAASFGATAGTNTYGAMPSYQQASLDDDDGL